VVGRAVLTVAMMTRRPVMVAVGGDSGSGKTTLVRGLYRIFGAERITNVCLDDYHKLDRAERKRLGVTALNPAANDIELMEEQIAAIGRGETVSKPTYDHSTGTFGPREEIEPREIVVVRGLFPLMTPILRSAFDLRVWLQPQEELKWAWKVKRDCAERGYGLPEVIRQIVDRLDDHRQHLVPQREHADLIVQFYPPAGYFRSGTEVDQDAHLNVRLQLAPGLPRLDLDDVLASAALDDSPPIRLTDEGVAPGATTLEIDGTVSPSRALELDERIWAHMATHRHLRAEEIGGYLDGCTERHSDPLALTQLLVAYHVVRANLARGLSFRPSTPPVNVGG
jgi:phosphoribulokinase